MKRRLHGQVQKDGSRKERTTGSDRDQEGTENNKNDDIFVANDTG